MLEAVAFDLDHTLFDSEQDFARARDAQLKEIRNHDYDIDREEYIQLTDEAREIFRERYKGDSTGDQYGKFMEIFFDLRPENPDSEELEEFDRIFYQTRLENQSLMPGAEESLSYAQDKGLKLGVITNAREIMTEERLKKFDLQEFFDIFVCSSRFGSKKSSLIPYNYFLDQLDLEGESCLMVGDDPQEDLKAKEVGMGTVLLERESQSEISPELQPDYKIKELGELKSVIENYLVQKS